MKRIFLFLFFCLIVCNVLADYESCTATLDMTKATYSQATSDFVIWKTEPVTITLAKAESTSSANATLGGTNNSNVTGFYSNQTVTISPNFGMEIDKIVFTCSTNFDSNSSVTNATNTSANYIFSVFPKNKFSGVVLTVAGSPKIQDIKITYHRTAGTCLFYESFDTNSEDGGNDGKWSSFKNTTKSPSYDNVWTLKNALAANKCIRIGNNSSTYGYATTPVITYTGDVRLVFKAAVPNYTDENTKINISTTSGTLGNTSIELEQGKWNVYKIPLTDVNGSTQITFASANTSKNRFLIDSVRVVVASYSRTVTPGYLGSICIPCSSSKWEGVDKVFEVSSIDNNTVTLTSVDRMKAGVPYIFRSNADASSVKFYYDDDLAGLPNNSTLSYLVGNYEPEVVPVGNYVLQKNQFKYVAEGTTITSGKNRCYLNTGGQAARSEVLGISVHDEESATDIDALDAINNKVEIFDIQGRRLNMVKKGLNIVNGKIVNAK